MAPSVPAHEDEPAAEPSPENKAAAVPTTVTAEPATVEPATAEPTTAEPATAEPARRGPVDQELDLTLDNPTDRALFQLGRLPTKLRTAIIHHGPCRPKGQFAIRGENGNIRIFYERHYHAHSGAMEIERQWLCFSPTMKKPYCQSCWLFGDPQAMQKEWAGGVSGNPKNFGMKIKSHEKTYLMRASHSGDDRAQEQVIATEATFWRKCLLRIINIIMTLAMMSRAFVTTRRISFTLFGTLVIFGRPHY